MLYLSDYTEQATTDLFSKAGAFFAFSDDQFDESKKDGVKYASLGGGLICPVESVGLLRDGLGSIREAGIAADLADNTKEQIIQRELANQECQLSMDYSVVVEMLKDYGITEAEVKAGYSVFYDYCIENDCF
jgi:hypothetical protein